MTRREPAASLSALARIGFTELGAASEGLDELAALVAMTREDLVDGAVAADPDAALAGIVRIARKDADLMRAALRSGEVRAHIWRVFGASRGLAEFFFRHPQELSVFRTIVGAPPDAEELRTRLLGAVGAREGFARAGDEDTWNALRVAYRRSLTEIAAIDLAADDPRVIVDEVTRALSDLAGAALEASLAVARTRLGGNRDEIRCVQLAIIGMGKAGARELNYLSDVDVIFVAGSSDHERLDEYRAVDLATRLARETMHGLSAMGVEPALWEVDAALRPEGKQGALVRTLSSHISYYERWAKSWEFQALLKARPLAGDAALGDAYIAAVQPKVWSSAARENFVDSVQRMRERVMEHIASEDVPYQIKLGAGGLRDIEFTVQLLQLVHGLTDPELRTRGTIESLEALVDGGYIGRPEAASFAADYHTLRVLEHRQQLRELSRTHLMPRDAEGLRVLARASRLADSGDEVWGVWERVRREVREIHTRLFYRPLLSAVASLPEGERTLSTEQAHDRLAAIGFADPAGALRHIDALTSGLSRKSTIQRHLMPVMVRWFADGSDPDYGLLSFRRISERLGDTHWFLRMLRDSSAAAESLTKLLSSSRYIGELMEWIPESVAWLDRDELLRPREVAQLDEEARAIQARHDNVAEALKAVRALRRRELLRTAMGAVLDVVSVSEMAAALTSITEVTIQAALRAVLREVVPAEEADFDFAIIGMGRLGGAELGFGSDADVLFVYEANGLDPERAQKRAHAVVAGLREHLTDHRLPLELDADLRPEGRNGVVVRSLEAYRAYYERWSLSWEAQALLRARGIAGSRTLIARFMTLADEVRYPSAANAQGLRDIKLLKARMEGERLPQGADPRRHLKLGPGSLSDVEWLVQLLQLQHAAAVPGLRTTSTLRAMAVAVDAGLLPAQSAKRLERAWVLASRLRSAITLQSGRANDVLPADRRVLDAVGRLLGYPDRSATAVEEEYLGVTRRARRDFEKLFYG